LLSAKPHLDWCYILIGFLFEKFENAEQTSSFQVVLESSNDPDHVDGNVEFRCNDACGDAVGDDSIIIRLNSSRASHGVALLATQLQVASQGT
jgi:hypothetical protein